jgi:SAM-dependent MidA family methyltransferase
MSVMRYTAVEVSAQQRSMHPTGIASVAEIPDQLLTGVIIANELLDNLPFRLFVFDGGWRESYVGAEGDRFVEHLAAVDQVPTCLPEVAPHGSRAAVQDAAREWVESAVSRFGRGRVIAVDYCTTTATMVTRPWREWLRTYASHGHGSHYLANVGDQDVTVEVAVDQLPAASVVSTQADFLRRHGIESLVEEGKQVWREHVSRPDLNAMRMRSRVSEAKALIDPNGLGGFSVLEWVTKDSV